MADLLTLALALLFVVLVVLGPVLLIGGLVGLSAWSTHATQEGWREAGRALGLAPTLGGRDDHRLDGTRHGRPVAVSAGAAMNLRGIISMRTEVRIGLRAARGPRADALQAELDAAHRRYQVLGAGLGASLAPDPTHGLRVDDDALVVSVPRLYRDASALVALVTEVEALAARIEAG